jgi:two-component system, NtrC family, nitrogen regulation sensor histidine kinase NtrY
MDSKPFETGRFALEVALRALAIGALAFVATRLVATTHYYATALLATGAAVLFSVGIARVIGKVIRLAARDSEQAPLSAARTEREQRLDYLQALLDTARPALIVAAADGHVTLANRAARDLAGRPVSHLEQIAALGPSTARHLLLLQAGSRDVITCADGRQMFASVTRFSAVGHEPQRLIALQPISGELDAVELKAWQDMAHVLAHEMMNSLTPIASLSESLESLLAREEIGDLRTRAPLSGDVTGSLEAIKRRSRGLIDFVERYRAFADLPLPRPERVLVGQFLQGIARLLDSMLTNRGIDLEISVDGQDLKVDADRHLLEQAIINLVRNAADAVGSQNQRRIRVSCRAHEGWIVFEVADSGSGIPESERDQVFIPFYTTKPGGSGIGLSLARKIALSHRGRLNVRANTPNGSVFVLELPATTLSSAAGLVGGYAPGSVPNAAARTVAPTAEAAGTAAPPASGASEAAVESSGSAAAAGPGSVAATTAAAQEPGAAEQSAAEGRRA